MIIRTFNKKSPEISELQREYADQQQKGIIKAKNMHRISFYNEGDIFTIALDTPNKFYGIMNYREDVANTRINVYDYFSHKFGGLHVKFSDDSTDSIDRCVACLYIERNELFAFVNFIESFSIVNLTAWDL